MALPPETLASLPRVSAGPFDKAAPHWGYYVVDTLDCPPFTMFTNNDCPAAGNFLNHGRFEPGSLKLWCALARTATAIIDIGANVGVFALAAASLRSDIGIEAYEPNPYAFARLRMHKQVNRFKQMMDRPHAMGEVTGVIDIAWAKRSWGPISSGTALGAHPEKEDGVERSIAWMTRLDAVVPTLGARGLMKIDVEGAEIVVLKGMGKLVEERPDIILETFHPQACDLYNQTFLPLGYRVFTIDEASGRLEETGRLKPASQTSVNGFNQFLSVRGQP